MSLARSAKDHPQGLTDRCQAIPAITGGISGRADTAAAGRPATQPGARWIGTIDAPVCPGLD